MEFLQNFLKFEGCSAIHLQSKTFEYNQAELFPNVRFN